MNRLLGVLLLALALTSLGCSQVDLSKALTVTDVLAGYHHVGVVDGDLNKMVPSVTFKVSNVGDQPISRIQLLVSFWQVGGENLELDSKQIEGIGAEALAPDASTSPILVRSEKGYTMSIDAAREQMFEHSLFQDVTVKLFARRDGRLVPLGEFPIERRIIASGAAAGPAVAADAPAATAP